MVAEEGDPPSEMLHIPDMISDLLLGNARACNHNRCSRGALRDGARASAPLRATTHRTNASGKHTLTGRDQRAVGGAF